MTAIYVEADTVGVATSAGFWVFDSGDVALHLEDKPIVAATFDGRHIYAVELGGRIWRTAWR